MTMAGKTDALTELCDLLAKHPDLAGDKLQWISGRCTHRGSTRITLSETNAVLASARYLANSRENNEDLLKNLADFMESLPDTFGEGFWPKMYSVESVAVFYTELLKFVTEIAKHNAEAGRIFSREIVRAMETSQGLYFQSAPCRAFVAALAQHCPRIDAEDADRMCSAIIDHWIVESLPPLLRSSSSSAAHVSSSSYANGEGSSPECSTPESIVRVNGGVPAPRSSLDYLALPSRAGEGAVRRQDVRDVQEEFLDVLERQDIAFRLCVHLLDMDLLANEQVQHVRVAASRHLRSLPVFLMIRKKDWTEQGVALKARINRKMSVCQAAALVHTRSLLSSNIDGKSVKQLLKETLQLLLDAADACVVSSWRKVKACEELFSTILSGFAELAVMHGSQILRVLVLRLKSLVLMTCSQTDTWGNNQGAMFDAVTQTCCKMVSFGWEEDRSSIESFIIALVSNIRERVDSEQEEKDKQNVPMVQLNVIHLLTEIAVSLKIPKVLEMILPPFIECLEEGEASTPCLLRLRLLDAVARMAGLGFEKSYRETVVLLTRSYLDKLSAVGSSESRTLAAEATSERVEILPSAFLSVAQSLNDARLRADYRHRLLALCSDVGLAAESKSGRSGADLLGPLLPSVAEICSDFNPIQDVDPTLLKLFRNLWFYIVLFGLAPPIQTNQPQTKIVSATINSLGSMSALALQAVGGPYMWNVQWSSAVQRITQGTPPLLVNSVKWLEDEMELNALHNPGSRRGSGNEKAAVGQRAALSAALGGRVDISSLGTISGVKATYLLAVSFLEIVRFTYNGGIVGSNSTDSSIQSAFICVFKYLETPSLMPAVYQCLIAIVHKAFEAAVSWLEGRVSATGEEADNREIILSAHACFFIRNIAHRDERIRELSVNLLNLLRNRFPQILWKTPCLDTLLFSVNSSAISALIIDPSMLATIHSMLQRVVREWVIDSLSYAPCTTQGLLQVLFIKLNTWHIAPSTSNVVSLLSEIRLVPGKTDCWNGVRTANIPAVIAAAAAASGSNVKMAEASNLEILSTGIASANVKSNYAGEIAGMKSIYATMGGLQPQLAMSANIPQSFFNGAAITRTTQTSNLQTTSGSFDEMLGKTYLRLLQEFVSTAEKGGDVDKASFHSTCSRAAALFLSNTGPDLKTNLNLESFSQLLRLLCWCPAYISTPEAIETGVFVWSWIVSAAPQLGSLVLAELVDAWLWTVDTKRGIFASGVENSGPAAKLRPHLTPGEPSSSSAKDPVEQITAHRIWLGFLLDRFEVIRHESVEQLLLFGRMLQGSLKSPAGLSFHPAATGAFFTLLTLGLKYCSCQFQNNLQNCALGFQILEDRVYRAAMGWFAYEPQLYDSDVKGLAQAESQAVTIFLSHLMPERVEASSTDPGSKRGQGNGAALTNIVDDSHPVWGKIDNYVLGKEKRKQLLVMLCQHEAERLDVWAFPLKETTAPKSKLSSERWGEYVKTAFAVDPRIAICLVARFPAISSIRSEVSNLVQRNIYTLRNISEALPFFVTPKAVEEDSPLLQQLPHWAPCSITRALEFLTPPFKGHLRVMAYVLRVLESYPPEKVTFFMPQLVQTLRYDEGKLVEGYLLKAAHRSNLFAHILIWQLQGEYPEGTDTLSNKDKSFYELLPQIKQRIIDGFSPEAKDVFLREFRFFDKVTSISGVLYPIPKEQRRAGIRRELEKIEVEGDDLYLPTAPNKFVRGIQVDSGIPLQSAAKVPIMITFNVVDKDGDPQDIKPQACIFKVGDDCRQDVLALQVISLLRDVFQAIGLKLYLFPYGVLPTGYERGIIEVVPNTRSRNQMGEITDGGLYEIFQQEYGPVGSVRFEEARNNFIVSSAGYAVASLLLQPKDRHNGNLLFDSLGRLVHIDFGFILETSPGGNMRFESAQFKLSHEMTQLLDPSGAMKSETWTQFVSLSVKGYLAARRYMDGIINTVLLMIDSGLPCFSRGDPIGNLRKRFHPEMTEREAANFMIRTCNDAYNKWSTAGYDLIQYLQQGIEK